MAASPKSAAARPDPAALLPVLKAARFGAVSAALLVPIFWHRRIEAGDLASHLYNAWLVQLIRQGQAPGLWIARQWNNVLFDWLLSWLGGAFGLHAGERIAVSLAVLIFFWGAFALIAAATRRAPWPLAPLLAVVSYGWTFEMGFLNYYISLGLSFFVLAAFVSADSKHSPRRFWRDDNVLRLLSLLVIPLVWLAHPLGVVCLVGVGAYTLLVKVVPLGYRRYLLLAAGIALFGIRLFLARRFEVKYNPLTRYLFFNGADQVALFSWRYVLLYVFFGIVCLVVLGDDAGRGQWRASSFWDTRAVPLQLYLVTVAAPVVLPSVVYLPQYNEPLSFLSSRLTSLTAVVLCWALAAAKPRKWHAGTYGAIAVVFFAFLYIDTGKHNGLEEQVEQAVATLPPGHRVVEHIDSGQQFRIIFEHIVDRACIGRCFSYSNYEPSTNQFRVRANPGNSIVTADPPNDFDDESEAAVVKALHPPVYEIEWCDAQSAKFCLRELSADELNDLVQGDF